MVHVGHMSRGGVPIRREMGTAVTNRLICALVGVAIDKAVSVMCELSDRGTSRWTGIDVDHRCDEMRPSCRGL